MRLVGAASVVGALIVPAIARAECDDVAVGGEQPFCSFRGTGYTPPMLSVDVSAVASRVVVSERSAAEGGVEPGPRDARGASLRFLFGLRGIYVGGEIVGLSLDQPTRQATLDRPVTTRSESMTPSLPGGAAVEIRTLVGAMRSHGRLLAGVELGFGLRDVFGELAESADDRTSAQGLVDVRAMGGVWLTPHISLAVQLGVGLVRDEHTMAVMFGYSPLPFNGTH
jgi:hypothetical protein